MQIKYKYKKNLWYWTVNQCHLLKPEGLRMAWNANISSENSLSLVFTRSGTKFAENHQLIKYQRAHAVFYRYICISSQALRFGA